MGWYNYDIYGGDETQTRHYNFLKWAKVATEDQIFNEGWLMIRKTKIPNDKIPIFEKNLDKVIKNMPKCKFWDEDKAIEWQMLLALCLDNKIYPSGIIREKGKEATEYLMGEHASDFTKPSKRRAALRNFLKRLNKIY